ncbi:DUF2735 domain-containing protein [Rhizobium sp. CG5]|uniref:DUF2735 domain-containing protein n=1 Tax=Rhizobium sp. CG5 TaxID=2726076 RepID=UPI002034233A|nr:DUF2735 domain-containing protein [Rhizobium sp. CG5]MCM2474833.1 DUF2735 domain-containing protein [Rhizobium sp. CG5]
MTMSFHRETAKIYQFPNIARKAFRDLQAIERMAGDAGPMTRCDAASGGSWYHEEAVREADKTTKS